MNLKGRIERDRVRISPATTERKLIEETEAFSPCGGKFQIVRGDCIACNARGIMPGQIPPDRVLPIQQRTFSDGSLYPGRTLRMIYRAFIGMPGSLRA